MVEGLIYLHSHNIVHRDMTLANLLLTKNMSVVSLVWTLIKSTLGWGWDYYGLCVEANLFVASYLFRKLVISA